MYAFEIALRKLVGKRLVAHERFLIVYTRIPSGRRRGNFSLMIGGIHMRREDVISAVAYANIKDEICKVDVDEIRKIFVSSSLYAKTENRPFLIEEAADRVDWKKKAMDLLSFLVAATALATFLSTKYFGKAHVVTDDYTLLFLLTQGLHAGFSWFCRNS